jgi:hypothetical protein
MSYEINTLKGLLGSLLGRREKELLDCSERIKTLAMQNDDVVFDAAAMCVRAARLVAFCEYLFSDEFEKEIADAIKEN